MRPGLGHGPFGSVPLRTSQIGFAGFDVRARLQVPTVDATAAPAGERRVACPRVIAAQSYETPDPKGRRAAVREVLRVLASDPGSSDASWGGRVDSREFSDLLSGSHV